MPSLLWAEFVMCRVCYGPSCRAVYLKAVSPISVKKCQEETYFGVVLSFKCYILTNYDIRKVSNIILWSYNL